MEQDWERWLIIWDVTLHFLLYQHQKDTTTPVYDNVMTLERRQSLVTSIQASRVETFKILFEKKVYTIEVIPLKDVSITNDDVELKDGI